MLDILNTLMRILLVQGPLKLSFDTINVFPAGITSVDISAALHALLHALTNAYNSTYTYKLRILRGSTQL